MKREELEKFSVEIDFDRIIEILRDYLEICHPKIEELKKTGLKKFQYFLLSTLIRIIANVNSLIILFPFFKQEVSYKLPINLILRSIVSDYLTIEYLWTFKDPMDGNNTAIINEINVLNLDFIKFQEALLIEELTYLKNKNVHPWSQEKVTEKIHQFYNDNLDYFVNDKGNYVLKALKTFRLTTSNRILEEGKIRNSRITEKFKFDRLKLSGLIEFAMPAFLPFKYFSQFQHPTSNMDDLIMSDPKFIDNRMILMALDLIFILTIQIFHDTIPNDELENKIKKCQEDLVKLIKK